MQLLAALQARNAMGGVPPGGGPAALANQPTPGGPVTAPGFAGPQGAGPGSMGGGDTGSDYASMLSDLRRADPNILMRQLTRMKQIFAAMLTFYLESQPNVSGKIARVIPHIDSIISEAQKSASTAGAVRQPIAMGAAQPTPQGTSGGPGAMGAVGPSPMGP